MLNGRFAKTASTIEVGDTVGVRAPPIWRTFSIVSIPRSRVGAALVGEHLQETTDASALEQLREHQTQARAWSLEQRKYK
ncbi:MAG: hypothetical protein KDB88_11765 [Flavobacteriales bacterium]|nr:hypothetical protein [Flavobacteriales bacterium]